MDEEPSRMKLGQIDRDRLELVEMAPDAFVRSLGGVASYPMREGQNLPTLIDPMSVVTEQYRTIKARIEYLSRSTGKAIRTLVITSPGSGDGKTLTALNLALVLAQDENKSVLMIDADLRKPGIRDYFEHRPKVGLIELLGKEVGLTSVLFRPEKSRLMILPSGTRATNPADLLGSRRMEHMVQDLAKRFDHVVIDTPPVGLFIDADVLGAFADACLVIVRAGKSQKNQVFRAVETMKKHNLIGLVLNDVRQTPFERYYAYDRYYYYRNRGGK